MLIGKDSMAKRQSGVSLIELMVGITVALILLSGVIAAFVNMNAASLTALKTAQLDTELRMISSLIVRDLQKAGYVDAWDISDPDNPVFRVATMGAMGVVILSDSEGDADTDCIIYSYDTPSAVNPWGDGQMAADGSESFGFRQNGTAIQMGTNVTCASDNGWQAITSNDVALDANSGLTFAIDAADSQQYVVNDENEDGDCLDAGDSCLDRRNITFTINASLANDDDVTMSYTSEVKLMNDRYSEVP